MTIPKWRLEQRKRNWRKRAQSPFYLHFFSMGKRHCEWVLGNHRVFFAFKYPIAYIGPFGRFRLSAQRDQAFFLSTFSVFDPSHTCSVVPQYFLYEVLKRVVDPSYVYKRFPEGHSAFERRRKRSQENSSEIGGVLLSNRQESEIPPQRKESELPPHSPQRS